MKFPFFISTAAGLILFVITARAGDWLDQSYITMDVGPAFTKGFDLDHNSVNVAGVFVRAFKPGIRGDLAFGHSLDPHWALEFETGMSWNPGSNPSDDLYQIPFLLNARYRVLLNDNWTIELRGGPGGVYTKLGALVASSNPFVIPREVDLDGFALACQAGASVNYQISPRAELNLGYKFLGSFWHRWDAQVLVPPGGPQNFTVEADAIFTHSVVLSLTLKF